MADVEAEPETSEKPAAKAKPKAKAKGQQKVAKGGVQSAAAQLEEKRCKRCAITKAITELYADQWTCKECDGDERGWERSIANQLGPKWLAEKEASDPELVAHAKGAHMAARQ